MPDVERIVSLVSRNRQTLMFSATMPPEIRRLADKFLSHPQEVQATPPATTAAGVEDHVTVVPAREKFQALRRLIETQEVDKALIFCNRKREVASLRRQLERAGLNVRDIHGDLEQAQRTQALDAFKRGEIDFLVATDVAARGLDIVSLPCVINYDVPTHADDYVHRVGRTGRAGQEGRAFTLVLPEERRYVDAITRLTGKDIPRLELPAVEAATDGEAAASRRGAARNGVRTRQASSNEASAEVAVEHAPDDERRSLARNGIRGERTSTQPAMAERAPAESRRALPRASKGARSAEPRPHRATGPVVGMGDHVPLFMRRPVPNAELLPELNDD
jgi:superfamily II DNA/RNA helicase